VGGSSSRRLPVRGELVGERCDARGRGDRAGWSGCVRPVGRNIPPGGQRLATTVIRASASQSRVGQPAARDVDRGRGATTVRSWRESTSCRPWRQIHGAGCDRCVVQPRAQPTADELDRARGLIATCRWTYARTVPEHPHEYALRAWLRPEDQAVFDWFAALIAGTATAAASGTNPGSTSTWTTASTQRAVRRWADRQPGRAL